VRASGRAGGRGAARAGERVVGRAGWLADMREEVDSDIGGR